MNEILPGVLHWTKHHQGIDFPVSSYFLVEEGVLIDPMEPEEGADSLREHGEPKHILLSNRHHYRESGTLAEAFGATVHASRPGMHEFGDGQAVEPFDYGDELPGGVKAIEVGVLCPDETALHIPAHSALAVADGVMRYSPELHFVPEEHLGEDAEAVKSGLRDAYARVVGELEFENLLPAHGDPLVGGASEALKRFATQS